MLTGFFSVPVRLTNSKLPFLFALNAIAVPIYLTLAERSPLLLRFSTLRLRQSPKAFQNSWLRAGLRSLILLRFKISTLELILSILYRDTTVSLTWLLFLPLRPSFIETSWRSSTYRLGLKDRLYMIDESPLPSPFWLFILNILSFFIRISESARILHLA